MTLKTDFTFLYLTHEDVRAAGLDMSAFVRLQEEHFRLRNRGETILPDKVVLDLGEHERGRINALPAYVGGGNRNLSYRPQKGARPGA